MKIAMFQFDGATDSNDIAIDLISKLPLKDDVEEARAINLIIFEQILANNSQLLALEGPLKEYLQRVKSTMDE